MHFRHFQVVCNNLFVQNVFVSLRFMGMYISDFIWWVKKNDSLDCLSTDAWGSRLNSYKSYFANWNFWCKCFLKYIMQNIFIRKINKTINTSIVQLLIDTRSKIGFCRWYTSLNNYLYGYPETISMQTNKNVELLRGRKMLQ